MNRIDLVSAIKRLAPAAPLCFASRTEWLEWVVAASVVATDDDGCKPLVLQAGQPVRFNTDINFCADCTQQHRASMARAGRCAPDCLKHLEAP